MRPFLFAATLVACTPATMGLDMDDAGSDAGRRSEDAALPMPSPLDASVECDAGEPLAPDAAFEPDAGVETDAGAPPVENVFVERDGLVVLEAEDYERVERDGERRWVRFDADERPRVEPDPDPPHVEGASGGAYLEALPDTRVTHDDPLVSGVSFHGRGDTGPRLTYRVVVDAPGTFVVWVRAYSTGSEDNGVHTGLDGAFPESGARVQLCAGKNQWTWSSAQRRDSNHCGTPRTVTLTFDTAGEHEVHVAMREDGFEIDKILLARETSYTPEGSGPPATR
ncbi:MAG: hypothetical protein R3B99_08230 [Polyangiales bacterium]